MIYHIITLILCTCPAVFTSYADPSDVISMKPGYPYKYEPNKVRLGFLVKEMKIFCYSGSEKALSHIFKTVNLRLDIESDDYSQYEGYTPSMVRDHYAEHKSIFFFSIMSTKKRLLKLDPFNQTCIGIEALEPYTVYVDVIRVDFWKVTCVLVGILTFWLSAKLSENAVFYYISGVLLGVFASFLILVWLASKLVPRRPMMYGVLLGGWTIGIYFIQILWDNLQVILVTYKTYVFWYILITGFTSFVVCYRLGPPKNKRSKNLIKWGLQLFSLLLIFFSSDFQEAASALDVLVVTCYYFPRSFFYKIRSVYKRRFPPKPRLLTDEEYYEQGARETARALEELRQYCSSPECKQWRIMAKLSNPKRFAEFMEGSSHLIDEEILDYETSRAEISESDDSEEEDNKEENNVEITDDEENNGGRESFRSVRPTSKMSQSYNGVSRDIGWRSDIIFPNNTRERRSTSYLYRSYDRDYNDN